MAQQKLPFTDVETGLIGSLKIICAILIEKKIATRKELVAYLRHELSPNVGDGRDQAAAA